MRQKPPVLDMTIEGDFVAPDPAPKPPFAARVLVWAWLIATVAAAAAIAVFAIWLLAILIPVALVAGLIAYLAFRYRLWKRGGSGNGIIIHFERRL